MSSTVIAINCDRRTGSVQRPASQTAVPTAKKAAPQENQFLRPRVLRKWALRRTIWQIAQQEQRLPSEIEQILWEELAPYLRPAQTRRAA